MTFRTLCMAIAVLAIGALGGPAIGAGKGAELYWQANAEQDFERQGALKNGKACHKAGVEMTRARLVELYGEKDGYADVAERPSFLCKGPCRSIGGGTLCDIVMYNKDQALDPGSWRAKP